MPGGVGQRSCQSAHRGALLNGGGVAISINGIRCAGPRRRLLPGLFYSGDCKPQFVLVQGKFSGHAPGVKTTGGKPAANLEVRENIYSLNQYGGNASVVVAPGAVCGRGVVVEDEINAKQGGGTQRILQTRVRKSQTAGRVARSARLCWISLPIYRLINRPGVVRAGSRSEQHRELRGWRRGRGTRVALVGAAERHGGQGGNKRPCFGHSAHGVAECSR